MTTPNLSFLHWLPSPVNNPAGENKPLVVFRVPVADPAHGACTCGWGAVPRHSPWRSSSPRFVAFRDKSTLSGPGWALLKSRSSAALIRFSMSSVVSADLPGARSCCRRACKATWCCSSSKAGFGHVTWSAPPAYLALGIASPHNHTGVERNAVYVVQAAYLHVGSLLYQPVASASYCSSPPPPSACLVPRTR